MRSSEFDVRLAGANDVDHYLALMNIGDFRRKKTSPYFSWFYMESSRKTSLLMACERGGQVVGQVGLQFRRLSGQPVGVIVDIVVAPALRGRGVFALLEKEAARLSEAEGACALTSFTNPKGTSALLRLGTWMEAVDIVTLECATPLVGRVTEGGTEKPSRFLHFSSENSDSDWRFRRHPEYKYRGWSAHGSTLWTKNFTDPGSGRTMTDLVSLGGREPADPRLLGEVIKQLSAEGANLFTAWALPGVPDERLLRSAGFSKSGQRRSLCVRWLSREAETRLGEVRWALSQSDTEVF